MDVSKSELSVLTRMFSASVVRELGQTGRSALLGRLLQQGRLAHDLPAAATVGEAFDRAFSVLRSIGNRDEYVYRSAITQKILLGQHNLRTATMLSEARVETCKVDVVVLNGTATAYEIKSERDSLARLFNQVTTYGRVFAAVNVVTSPKHISHVVRLVPREVGVMVLSKKFTLQVERASEDDPDRIDPLAVLDFVRIGEATSILRGMGIEVPRVPNTQMRRALGDEFAALKPSVLHQQMVRTLKQTRSQVAASAFINTVPLSLQAALLSLKLDSSAQRRLREATSVPVHAALSWS